MHPSRPRGTSGHTRVVLFAWTSQRQFQWGYFVQRRLWFAQYFEVVGFFITAFEVAWSNRGHRAVFLGQRSDGRMFTVNPRDPQAKEFSWDTGDIAEIRGGGSPWPPRRAITATAQKEGCR